MDEGGYPVSRLDNELKRTIFYMKACSAVSSSELDDAKMELSPRKASRTWSAYAYSTGSRVRHYENMNSQVATAYFNSRPDEMTLSQQDTWYGPITLRTTSSAVQSVKVVANPNDDTPLLEIGSSSNTSNYCRNGAEKDDDLIVNRGTSIKIAMCAVGTGTLELRDLVTDRLINSYIVSLSSNAVVVPEPVTVAPLCSTASLSSASSTGRGTWSSSDCTSPHRANRYVDYYRITPSSSQRVRIDLTSSRDTYLLFYNGTGTAGEPDDTNDDYGGMTNSRLTVDLIGGRTYTIGVTTYATRVTGAYQLIMTSLTSSSLPALATPSRPAATAGNGRLSLDWSSIANATGYEAQQWDSTASAWVALPSGGATVSFSGSSATVRGLTNGVAYHHRVRAMDSTRQSSWSGYSTATPTVTLTLPRTLQGTGYSSGRISLDWGSVSNAAGYDVQQWDGRARSWRTLPFTEQGFSSEFRITFSGSSANVYELTRGVTYSHRVRAKTA